MPQQTAPLKAGSVAGKTQMGWLAITLLSMGIAEGATAAPAKDPATGSSSIKGVPSHWIQEADRQRDGGAYHLEAAALEKALAELPLGHPSRWSTAQRLVSVYRGGMGHFNRAAYWAQTLAEELGPTPAGIDALFELADTRLNHGHLVEALAIYREILSAASIGGRFERPDDFDLEQFFRGSFGIIQADQEPIEIAVQFKGVAAAVVEERIWHDSQKLEWLPATANLFDHEPEKGDSLVATFKLAEVIEFKKWLKGFGDQAVVLRPDWLRKEIHDELLAAAARYEG